MWSDAARQAAAEARANSASHQQGVNQVPSAAAHELHLYADNHADLYRQSYTPIMQNLTAKNDKGVYDSSKAETLWGYHADRAAQAYAKEFGGGQPWHKMFSPSDRRQAASAMEKANRSSVQSGEFRRSR